MKAVISLFAIAIAVAGTAHAADEKAVKEKKPTAQQQKMKSCNADAKSKGLKGDERKQFMSSCLKA